MNKSTIFLNRRQKVAKVGKKSDFFYFRTFHCVILQSQSMVFSHKVCKIALKNWSFQHSITIQTTL
jgi:hypothetical protein